MTTEESREDLALLAEAERIVRTVQGVRAPRRAVTAKRREAIGERDEWICCICRRPIDKTLSYLQPDLEIDVYVEHLATLNPRDMKSIIAWMREDPAKAHAIHLARFQWRAAYWDAPKAAHTLYARHVAPLVERYRHRNDETASVEHLTPVSLGGTNEDSNLAIAHLKCNRDGGGGQVEAPYRAAMRASNLASRFLRGAQALRLGEERSRPPWLARWFEEICAWLELQGRGHEVPDSLRAGLPTALDRLAEPHRPRWEAEHAARKAEWERRLRVRWLKSQITSQEALLAETDKKIESLHRADAIDRWKRKRATQRARLTRLKRELGRLEPPRPEPRPFDPFDADMWAEATDPDDPFYLYGTAMMRD